MSHGQGHIWPCFSDRELLIKLKFNKSANFSIPRAVSCESVLQFNNAFLTYNWNSTIIK